MIKWSHDQDTDLIVGIVAKGDTGFPRVSGKHGSGTMVGAISLLFCDDTGQRSFYPHVSGSGGGNWVSDAPVYSKGKSRLRSSWVGKGTPFEVCRQMRYRSSQI